MFPRRFVAALARAAFLFTAAPLGGAAVAGTAAADRPNIVFILADDLGQAQIGCYGSTFYRTPQIDSLARDGLRFTDAYSAGTICSPTRAALMTGKYPARLRLTDYIPGTAYPWQRLRQPEWQKFLPLAETTLAEALAAAGYATALYGKWHLSRGYRPPESIEHGPDRQGFEDVFITHKPSGQDDPTKDAHGVDAITDRALAFIERQRARPFFLFLSHNSIHSPVMERPDLVAKYRQRPGSDRPENNPVIGAMLETLDAGVGRVLAKLDELGLAGRTLVIFYSDNGGLLRDAAQTPWRSGKGHLYEGGVRVPLLVRWPGVVRPGVATGVPVTTVDFFPTLLDVARAEAAPAGALDGLSLAPLLRAGTPPARDAIFWHYPHYHPSGAVPSGAIREGDWKLIESYEATLLGHGPGPQLYHLASDPAETTDLAARHPERTAALLARLAAWRTAVGAQMPAANPAFDPARQGKLK